MENKWKIKKQQLKTEKNRKQHKWWKESKVKKVKNVGEKLTYLLFFCIYVACSICFLFAFSLYFFCSGKKQKTNKINAKKTNGTNKINAKTMQMHKSICFPLFSFCLSFFSLCLPFYFAFVFFGLC
jgi:hypothetical protein